MKSTRSLRIDGGTKTKRLDLRQLNAPVASTLSKIKPAIDLKYIALHPELYKQNCLDRNYGKQSHYPLQIARLYEERRRVQDRVVHAGRESKEQEKIIQDPSGTTATEAREATLARARELKQEFKKAVAAEHAVYHEMEKLAIQLPNMTSDYTPIGTEPRLLGYINAHLVPASAFMEELSAKASTSRKPSPPENLSQPQEQSPQGPLPSSEPPTSAKKPRPLSHLEIGNRLDLFNFDASSQSSGWGFYYLQRGAALLEQALIQYAIHLCTSNLHAFIPVTPPSIVYTDIANAAGYLPRDANDERQTYALTQTRRDIEGNRPEHSLAGTAEIPFAALHVKTSIPRTLMPKAVVGPSRCFRAEAGARGKETKGLYRVHEFTKVEMFGWTLPNLEASLDLFQTMLDLQMRFYTSLGLRCRVLEMPSRDLGASAMRKIDIEAYFPGREGNKNGPWGEVSSLSLCGDYQTRRLQTTFEREQTKGEQTKGEQTKGEQTKGEQTKGEQTKGEQTKGEQTKGEQTKGEQTKERKPSDRFPWTVNGTACAVPRVLAVILEVGWDREREVVKIPQVLWRWMGGMREIGPPASKEDKVQVGQGGGASGISEETSGRMEGKERRQNADEKAGEGTEEDMGQDVEEETGQDAKEEGVMSGDEDTQSEVHDIEDLGTAKEAEREVEAQMST